MRDGCDLECARGRRHRRRRAVVIVAVDETRRVARIGPNIAIS